MKITTAPAFAGFPAEGLAFLAGLREDNSKAFFDAHRPAYEGALLAPARAFVVALADELRTRVSPAIRAEPHVNGSILRINRDIRFNVDKRPYKTYLDMVVWAGEGHSRERPGFFVRLEPEGVTLSAGIHRFERPASTRIAPPSSTRRRARRSRTRSPAAPPAVASRSSPRTGCGLRAASTPTTRA
ncbi:MAG: hypothetical protein QOD81_4442 [Solirubrobacteraceae bacterium]|nr:hypothetical protein [Solirubrobacteraceae bacterium]